MGFHIKQFANYPCQEPKGSKMKYNEDKILKEIEEYIASTYGKHYAYNGLQTLDVLDEMGIAVQFCRGNIIKYAMRFGKKEGYNEQDIYKIIHYSVLLLHFLRKRKENAIQD